MIYKDKINNLEISVLPKNQMEISMSNLNNALMVTKRPTISRKRLSPISLNSSKIEEKDQFSSPRFEA